MATAALTAKQWVRRERLVLCKQKQTDKKLKSNSVSLFGTCWAKQTSPYVPYVIVYSKSVRYPTKNITSIRHIMQKLIELKISKPFAAVGNDWFAVHATPYARTLDYILDTKYTSAPDRMLYVQKLQPKLKSLKRKLLNSGVCLKNGLQSSNLALYGNQVVCANCADVVFSCLQTQPAAKNYTRQLKSLHTSHKEFPRNNAR